MEQRKPRKSWKKGQKKPDITGFLRFYDKIKW
jgi:hypothetical protein